MQQPDPSVRFPIPGDPHTAFLKPIVTSPFIEVGEFTYYNDPDGPEHFEARCVLQHFDRLGDRLVIGRFCALATGIRFFMSGANHPLDIFSGYPFDQMAQIWQDSFDEDSLLPLARGDIIVGHDVWIGNGATILPGVRIGNGAVVATQAVVTKNVPAYGIVAGNPARLLRLRFDEETIAALQRIAWWDWTVEKITRNIAAIRSNDVTAMAAAM
ncbi:MAG: CatB-related O-acetyltransferase [Alphaproteobacteria bacterium]|nr:CatB-related O-acetyltransferase [Alphaproteobacteria bacterium]